jgi:hypothetical protein
VSQAVWCPARRDLTEVRRQTRVKVMDEITLQIQHDEESGWLVASWDAPDGSGGITTQGQDLRDLQHQVTEAVAAYFDEGEAPRRILNALR